MKIIVDKIGKLELPHREHMDFLDKQIEEAMESFDAIEELMLKDILKLLKKEKLAKSDLPRGYTGKLPQMEIDLKVLNPVIDQYLDVIKWMFMGKGAGKEIEDLVKTLGLMNTVPAGLVYGTFLHSIDTQRDYYKYLTGKEAPKVPNEFLEYALDLTQNKTTRFLDQSLTQFKNNIITAIENEIAATNLKNLSNVHSSLHEELSSLKDKVASSKEKSKMLEEIIEDVSTNKLSIFKAKKAIKEAMGDFSEKLESTLQTELAAASSAGTHTAVQEIFGAKDNQIKVAIVSVRDARCCDFCEKTSRNPDGSVKMYNLRDLGSANSNMGKKKSEWKPTLSPQHPRCRCTVVYVPQGMKIEEDGTVVLE